MVLLDLAQRPGSQRTLLTSSDGARVCRSVLPSGIRVLTESVPGARSVALGLWVGVGSRDEGARAGGASHFLEHLLFKGTDRRSAYEISAAIEAVGGDLNAFTSKECTCFHARVLADDLGLATDVLTDMVTSSRLAAADFDAERQVVIEELAMNEDDPADVARQAFARLAYGTSPLARPIIGTVAGLRAITRAQVIRHYRRHYRPGTLVVTAAGAVEHRHLVSLVKTATRGWKAGTAAGTTVPARALRDRPRRISKSAGVVVTTRPTEQAHLVLGFPGIRGTDERRWPLAALDVALGGGMSSRLFQEVRERRGLAYSVATFRSGYSDAGLIGVYAGTQPTRANETVAVIREVLAQAASEGLEPTELERAKGQLRGSSVLETEDPGARMSRLGEAEILTGSYLSVDDLIERIDGINQSDVAAVAATLLVGPETLSVVGPYESDHDFATVGGR